MKGPVLAIVAVLTLLSVAASCVLPLMWTRGEITLHQEVWSKKGLLRTVDSYREPALGMATSVIGSGPAKSAPTPTWPQESGWIGYLLHGWTPVAHDRSFGEPFRMEWTVGTGWPMLCAISRGEIKPRSPSSGPLRLVSKVKHEYAGSVHDRSSDFSDAFNQWPNSIHFPNLAINLLVHGLAWFLLVWLFVKGFRAFMPRVE